MGYEQYYTVLYKYGYLSVIFCTSFLLFSFSFSYFEGIFNKTITSLTLVGYEMIKANLVLRTSLTSYHPIPMCAPGITINYYTLTKKSSIHISVRVILQPHIVQCVAASYWTHDTSPVRTLSLCHIHVILRSIACPGGTPI